MTRAKWAALSPEEQHIKIAELCRWREVRYSDGHDASGATRFLLGERDPSKFWAEILPDYLNAMHEAENILGTGGQETFQQHLSSAQNKGRGVQRYVTHATAAQRAEALCLTMEPE